MENKLKGTTETVDGVEDIGAAVEEVMEKAFDEDAAFTDYSITIIATSKGKDKMLDVPKFRIMNDEPEDEVDDEDEKPEIAPINVDNAPVEGKSLSEALGNVE